MQKLSASRCCCAQGLETSQAFNHLPTHICTSITTPVILQHVYCLYHPLSNCPPLPSSPPLSHHLAQTSELEFTGSTENDIRVIGFAVVILLLAIALIGLDWEAKVRYFNTGFISGGYGPLIYFLSPLQGKKVSQNLICMVTSFFETIFP